MNKCEHSRSVLSVLSTYVCGSVATHFYLIESFIELKGAPSTYKVKMAVTARCENHALTKDTSIKATELYTELHTLTEITESEYDVFKVMDD